MQNAKNHSFFIHEKEFDGNFGIHMNALSYLEDKPASCHKEKENKTS